jgi:hypothetical protein
MFPFLISNKHDRGWATERAWSRFGVFHNGLAEWRQDAKRGIRPAVVFNGTVAETGERFLMGTIDPLPSGGVDGADRAGTAVGRRTFHETYYPNDIHPVTAARLSANFPYVSPASRINYWVPKSKRLHIVDGGYYDNYGVSTAAELLDQATKGLKSRGSTPLNRILLIEIAGAESVTADAARTTAPNSCEEDTDMSREPLNKAGNRGWFFQTFAPLKTMFEVRSTGQRSHNETEIGLLAETLNGRGILLQRVRFTFPCQQTPLSWHLTEVQKNNIDRAWQTRYAADVKSQELKAVTCHIAIPGAKSKEEFLACLKD